MSGPCLREARCENLPGGGYLCHCPLGFTGMVVVEISLVPFGNIITYTFNFTMPVFMYMHQHDQGGVNIKWYPLVPVVILERMCILFRDQREFIFCNFRKCN